MVDFVREDGESRFHAVEPRLALGRWGRMTKAERLEWLSRCIQANEQVAAAARAELVAAEARIALRLKQIAEVQAEPEVR